MYGLDSYVNASFVKIGNINFIAASYPKPKYQNQFFELLRKSETSLIVSFHTDSDDYFKDCEIISDMGENEVYDAKIYEVGDLHVKRLLMKTWNDFNVPIRSELEEFYVFFTENLPMDREINVLVHCYAGVGRTGTFILYHALMKMENVTVNDVLEMFVVLRAHRPYLVYNTAQLEFVLNCFISKEQ
ncbi:Receptor-type tyrosine-protein phosphatase V [Dictyocoela roeselum]|nr:Receptor-type tyrosine-protein phosphatase V [Dictyocoela roeselum]